MSHMMLDTMFNPVAYERIGPAQQLAPAVHRCSSPSCTSDRWQVQCLSAHDQLWRVSNATGGSYLVAGATPACPWCGADLLVAAEVSVKPYTNGLHKPSSEHLSLERVP